MGNISKPIFAEINAMPTVLMLDEVDGKYTIIKEFSDLAEEFFCFFFIPLYKVNLQTCFDQDFVFIAFFQYAELLKVIQEQDSVHAAVFFRRRILKISWQWSMFRKCDFL